MIAEIQIHTPLEIRSTVSQVLLDLSDIIAEENVFAVRLVLNELLANSLIHGKGTRTVLSYTLNGDCICGTISDDGEWYAAKEVVCSGVDKTHGRGVYLASCYAQALKYDEDGHRVCFNIKLR